MGSHGKPLKPGKGSSGYLFVVLSRPPRLFANRMIHVLVTGAFIGPRPDGMQVRHLDGNKLNNRTENLSYGTPSENQFDRTKHGTNNAAKTHCKYKHEFTPANTRVTISKQGWTVRTCLTCEATRGQNRRVANPQRAQGERSGQAKLTEAVVREARTRRASGESYASIARDAGVTRAVMRRAVLGLSWAHI
jgi:hypothetical protein